MNSIMKLMQAMGYKDLNQIGVCFGLAQGLIQAHLNGEKDWVEIHKMLASGHYYINTLLGVDAPFPRNGKRSLYEDSGAIKAADCGVDGLVVEGTEGGGFKSPEEVGLFVLIQAIRKKIDLPIIAAGGIADGAGMAAAFAVGAEGIQMGTRFVSSKESPVHDNFKNSILSSNEQSTWILNKKSKPCIRALKTDFTSKIHESGIMEMTDMMRIQDLYFGGDMNAAPALTGQSAGLIDQVKSVSNIIEETILEFNETCKKMSSQQF